MDVDLSKISFYDQTLTLINYKEVIGKRVNPFDNKNVAKRAIIAFFFLGALRRKDHCCEQY